MAVSSWRLDRRRIPPGLHLNSAIHRISRLGQILSLAALAPDPCTQQLLDGVLSGRARHRERLNYGINVDPAVNGLD